MIHPSAIIEDGAQLGADVSVGPFCIVGSKVVLGDRVELKSHVVVTGETEVREHVTMNPGTEAGGGVTSVGDDGFFLAGCHIAHDVRVGDRVIIVNQSAVAGHCVRGRVANWMG